MKGDTTMCPKCARPMEEGGECGPCAEDREDHADLRTQFAIAISAASVTDDQHPGELAKGAAKDGGFVRGVYELADALAREDARRRAEDAK